MEGSTLEEGSLYQVSGGTTLNQPNHPLDRFLFFGQQSLFPVNAVRLRIELGHRTDACGLLLVNEEHEMPTRRQLSLDLRGGPATQGGFDAMLEHANELMRDWAKERWRLQQRHHPF